MQKKTINLALLENKAHTGLSVLMPSGSVESWIIQPRLQANAYTNSKHLNNGSTVLT